MTIVEFGSVMSGFSAEPLQFAAGEFTPETEYTVRLVKPNVLADPEYRWVREGLWQYAEIPLPPSGGPDSPVITWEVNRPGQLKVSVDRARFALIWSEADFNEGGAPIKYLVPQSVTMWVFRGTQPLWAGFLMDVEADPTGDPNVTLTGEEFTGQWADITFADDWTVTAEPVRDVLEQAVARELRTAWMHVHDHGSTGVTETFTTEILRKDQKRISELVDQLTVAADFEWQQWIGPAQAEGTWEAHLGIHPWKAGFDFQTQGLNIEWGEGTAETAWSVRYTFTGRTTRTRWSVIGADETMSVKDYNIPLGMPRRDGTIRDESLPADVVPLTAESMVRRQGLPQLSARAVLRVASGAWPFLWLYATAGTPGTGGCSPVGSRFWVRIVDAGFDYQALMRASTWGIAITPGNEWMVIDLVQDDAAAAGLDLEIQTVV